MFNHARFALGAALSLGLAASASVAFAGQQDFVLLNKTGYTVSEVYVSSSASDDWEEDVLGQDVLANGQRVEINFETSERACLFDLKVVYSDGDTAIWQALNLCKVSVVAISYDRRTGETTAETD